MAPDFSSPHSNRDCNPITTIRPQTAVLIHVLLVGLIVILIVLSIPSTTESNFLGSQFPYEQKTYTQDNEMVKVSLGANIVPQSETNFPDYVGVEAEPASAPRVLNIFKNIEHGSREDRFSSAIFSKHKRILNQENENLAQDKEKQENQDYKEITANKEKKQKENQEKKQKENQERKEKENQERLFKRLFGLLKGRRSKDDAGAPQEENEKDRDKKRHQKKEKNGVDAESNLLKTANEKSLLTPVVVPNLNEGNAPPLETVEANNWHSLIIDRHPDATIEIAAGSKEETRTAIPITPVHTEN